MNLQIILSRVILIVAFAIIGPVSMASAETIDRFTATNSLYGVLGYIDYNSADFDGSDFQYLDNSHIVDLKFVSPYNFYTITTPGSDVYGAYIDSTGIPTIAGSNGFVAGTSNYDGVQFFGRYLIDVADHLASGQPNNFHTLTSVSWSTSTLTLNAGVPEPMTWAMMLTGFAGVGGVLRARRRRGAAPA